MNLNAPFCHSKKYRNVLKKLYMKIIAYRKANPCTDAHGEIHHIIPKHICKKFGIDKDSPKNKVRLSVKEHAYVHMLLDRAHGYNVRNCKSLKEITRRKMESYQKLGLELTGKPQYTGEMRHEINMLRREHLTKCRAKINDLMVQRNKVRLMFGNAICNAIRNQLKLPMDFELSVSKKLLDPIVDNIHDTLTVSLPVKQFSLKCALNKKIEDF